MRKLVFLLFCVCTLHYAYARDYYETGNRHELSVGIGGITSTDLFSAPLKLDSYDLVDEDEICDRRYTYSPAFDVNYFAKVGRKVKLGLNFTYQQTTVDTRMLMTDAPSSLYEKLDNCTNENERLAVNGLIENYKEAIEYWQGKSGVVEKNHFVIMPQVKISFISREHFAFYQRYGLGVDIKTRTKDGGNRSTGCSVDLAIVPSGFEFGGLNIRGFVEFPAFSAQGIFHAGLKYEF